MRLAPPALTLLVAVAVSGCSSPKLTRESPLHPVKPLARPVALAVSYGPEISPLMRTRLEEALARDPDIASVNTTGASRSGERSVRLGTTARSASLGTNFLVSFPGFLGFAPLWHRFQWIYRVRTWAELAREGEPPLILSDEEKFIVADTTMGQALGSELGFFGYGLPGVGAGFITATAPAIQTRFDESLGREAGRDWARDAVALIHAALIALAAESP